MTTTTRGKKINSAEWRIPSELRFRGLVHGTGDPVPAMTEAEAEQLRAEGRLIRVGETTHTYQLEQLLKLDDAGLIRALRPSAGGLWPSRQFLQELLDEATRTRRSATLLEALSFAVRQPLTSD